MWGDNSFGQLGVGDSLEEETYVEIPRVFLFNTQIQTVRTGKNNSAFIAFNGQLFMFGSNSRGKLGINSRELMINEPMLIERFRG